MKYWLLFDFCYWQILSTRSQDTYHKYCIWMASYLHEPTTCDKYNIVDMRMFFFPDELRQQVHFRQLLRQKQLCKLLQLDGFFSFMNQRHVTSITLLTCDWFSFLMNWDNKYISGDFSDKTNFANCAVRWLFSFMNWRSCSFRWWCLCRCKAGMTDFTILWFINICFVGDFACSCNGLFIHVSSCRSI